MSCTVTENERGAFKVVNGDRRLTTGHIGRYCHVSRGTVLKWIKSEKLRAYVLPDGQYRITQASLVDFLKAYNMPIDEELFTGVSQASGAGSGSRA